MEPITSAVAVCVVAMRAAACPDRLKAAAAVRIPATVGFHEIKDGGETRAKLSRAGVTRVLPAEPVVRFEREPGPSASGGLGDSWARWREAVARMEPAAYVEFCVARADALLKQFPAFRRFRRGWRVRCGEMAPFTRSKNQSDLPSRLPATLY